MRSKWTDLIVEGFQSVVSSFNPSNSKAESERESAPSGQRDNHIHDLRPSKRNHAPPLSASHASRPTESRVQMPVSRSTRQSKSNSVKEFLNQHDNAECDPIIVSRSTIVPGANTATDLHSFLSATVMKKTVTPIIPPGSIPHNRTLISSPLFSRYHG